mgnify:CR=1 FL=1
MRHYLIKSWPTINYSNQPFDERKSTEFFKVYVFVRLSHFISGFVNFLPRSYGFVVHIMNTDIYFVFSLINWKQSSISAITQGMDLWKFCFFWSKRNDDRLVLQKLNCSTSIFIYELSAINPALSTLKLCHIVVIIYIWDTHDVYYTHLGTLKCKLTNQCVFRWLYWVYRMLSISV